MEGITILAANPCLMASLPALIACQVVSSKTEKSITVNRPLTAVSVADNLCKTLRIKALTQQPNP
jgi:hypothetical protein